MWGGGERVRSWSGFSLLSLFSQPTWVSSVHTHTQTYTRPCCPHCTLPLSSIFFIQFPLTYQEQPAYQQREPSPSTPLALSVQTLLLWGWNVCFIKSATEAQQWPLMFDCVIPIMWAGMRAPSHSERLFQRTGDRLIIHKGPADHSSLVNYNSNRCFKSTD